MTDSFEEDEPLDPTLERVRKKMIRLLVISIGIMVIGLMAVFGAIVYKIGNPETGNQPESTGGNATETNARFQADFAIGIPDDARVLSADLSGNRLVMRVKLADGNLEIIIVDLSAGTVASRISVLKER